MKKLLRNKKGFTLMEMLIVVAIIVILVAISVPTFSASLNDAKKAADDANFRAAKAALVVAEIDGTVDDDYVYDIDAGKFVQENASSPIKAYGQSSDNKGDVIRVTENATTGEFSIAWETATAVSE